MIIYTKEKGNHDTYEFDHDKKTVTFEKSDFLVSASIVLYTEQDEKLIVNRYNDFKRIFNSELVSLYKNRRWEGIKYFIRKVLNTHNFVFSITNKSYVLAKILFFTIMGRQTYISRPGYSLSLISDLAKMKDDLVYPLLFTCNNVSDSNFKKLLKVVLNCPYYLTEFHNILKQDVQQIYWGSKFDSYLAELTKYNLQDQKMYDNYIAGFNFSNLVERFTSGSKNANYLGIEFVHDTEYRFTKEVMFQLGFSNISLEYKDKKESTFLLLLDDLSKFFHMLINDCFDIVNNNRLYDNELFNILSYMITLVYQENFEFQIPTSQWSTLMGITDLCNDSVSAFYKRNDIVDNIIAYHYTRINEYLKNHFDDKRAFAVFKNRV